MPYINYLGKVQIPCSRDLAQIYQINHAELFAVLVRCYFILPSAYRAIVDSELSKGDQS